MKKARLAAQSRSQLDERFRELGPAKRYTPPVRGWIKALREALGMSTAQLAKRLGIRQPSLVALEQSEAKGTIELATLRRVAEALDCTLSHASDAIRNFWIQHGIASRRIGAAMGRALGSAADALTLSR